MVEVLLWISGILFFGSILFKYFFKVTVDIGKTKPRELEEIPEELADLDTLELLRKNQIQINDSMITVFEQMNEHEKHILKNKELHESLVPILTEISEELVILQKKLDERS